MYNPLSSDSQYSTKSICSAFSLTLFSLHDPQEGQWSHMLPWVSLPGFLTTTPSSKLYHRSQFNSLFISLCLTPFHAIPRFLLSLYPLLSFSPNNIPAIAITQHAYLNDTAAVTESQSTPLTMPSKTYKGFFCCVSQQLLSAAVCMFMCVSDLTCLMFVQ